MSAARVSQQIHEGLVKFNPNDLTIINAVAESWEKSADDLVYTFSIKKNVFFHDDPCFENGKGRQVNAHDFIYSFELLCGNNRNNSNYEYLFKEQVVGAKSFHSGHAKSIEGIVALDDFTLSITLVSPNPTFIYSLASPACVVIPKPT